LKFPETLSINFVIPTIPQITEECGIDTSKIPQKRRAKVESDVSKLLQSYSEELNTIRAVSQSLYTRQINVLKCGFLPNSQQIYDLFTGALVDEFKSLERKLRAQLVQAVKQEVPSARPNFNKEQTAPLQQWLLDNSHNPYPTDEQKELLAEMSGLTYQQVHTWFNNARSRKKVIPKRTKPKQSSLTFISPSEPMPPDEPLNLDFVYQEWLVNPSQ
jgi:hypothetical protein